MATSAASNRQPLVVQTDSFLIPTGPNAATQHAPPSRILCKWGEAGLFLFFVFTRAVHPAIIAESKTLLPSGNVGYAYSSTSTIIVLHVFVFISMQIVALLSGGLPEWKSIWTNTRALQVFSSIGFVAAIGDYLEMASLGSLSGDAYQVLLQSKFIVTALLMMCVKGTVQTRLQWMLLISLTLMMSVYMSMTSKSKQGSGGGEVPLFGMLLAFLKVIVSCLGAVLSDKYMKDLKYLPTHVQLVQMGISRLLGIVLIYYLAEMDPEKGMFDGWSPVVCGVTISFVVKSVSTLYIVAHLDALLKNIGEALAVPVIYMWMFWPSFVCAATSSESSFCDGVAPFDLPTFLSVFLVIMLVAAYLDTKDVIAKAKKYDQVQAQQTEMQMGHMVVKKTVSGCSTASTSPPSAASLGSTWSSAV